MRKKGTLIFFCGKMGAGKSTKARQIAREKGAILISEDQWLETIYPGEIQSVDDYIRYSSQLKPLLKDHVRDILNAGISVVLDFPGNTKRQRLWFKEIFAGQNIPHKLIYLDVPDQICLKQIAQRRKTYPERAEFDTEVIFHRMTGYFQVPAEDEGFDIELVSGPDA
jgi:predicted kinase